MDYSWIMNATTEQLAKWRDEIDADKKMMRGKTDAYEYDVWIDDAELEERWKEVKAEKNKEDILRVLKLAGIQNTLNMTDDEFIKRGEGWLYKKYKEKKYNNAKKNVLRKR